MLKVLMTSATLLLLAVAAHAEDAATASEPDSTRQEAKAAAPQPAESASASELTHQDVKVSAGRPAEPELTCHQEAQTGSSILHKVCRKKELTPSEQAAIRDDRQQIINEAG